MKALEWSQNHTIGFLQALEIMEKLEIHGKKVPAWNNHGI